jgi:hypothetical protein
MGALFNIARMTTPTTGNGATLTLGSAVSGFLTFAQAGVADGQTVSYGIRDGNASEVGNGVYASSGTTLTRNVTKSTNADARLSLSGSAQVYVTALAEDINAKVAKAGDTMTGNLTINLASPVIYLNKVASGGSNVVQGQTNSKQRWNLQLGNLNSETGSNAGSDFQIDRCNDAGAVIDSPIVIYRNDGKIVLNGVAVSGGGLALRVPSRQYAGVEQYERRGFDHHRSDAVRKPGRFRNAAVFNINADGPNVYWCDPAAIVGSVSVNTTSTSYATSSDERLKDNFR